MPWFYFWSQENQDINWESFSTALIKRFKDSHVFERLPTLEKEEQTERETYTKEVVTLKK